MLETSTLIFNDRTKALIKRERLVLENEEKKLLTEKWII